MSVVYALVARQQHVLCEHTEGASSGNFPTVTRAVLRHLADQESSCTSVPSRSVFPYNEFNFFFLHDDGLTYLCMAEERVHANVAFLMLTDMKDRFVTKYGTKGKTAIAYAMSPFASEIRELMKKYDNYKIETPLSQLRQKMEHVKIVMIENVNQLMERGEKIDLLVVRTDKLRQESARYQRVTKEVRRMYCWENLKYMVILFLCVCLLLFIITFMVCGIDFSSCGRRIGEKAKGMIDHQIDNLDKFKHDAVDHVNGHLDKIGDAIDHGGVGGE